MAKNPLGKDALDRRPRAAERMPTTGRPRARHLARTNVRTGAPTVPTPRRKRS